MGDYTEFHFNAQLKANTPSEVVVTLNQMLGHTKIGQERPKHPLFSTDRWDIMLTCDSAYLTLSHTQRFVINEQQKVIIFVSAAISNTMTRKSHFF